MALSDEQLRAIVQKYLTGRTCGNPRHDAKSMPLQDFLALHGAQDTGDIPRAHAMLTAMRPESSVTRKSG